MEYMQNKLYSKYMNTKADRQEFLADIVTGSFKVEQSKNEFEIYVDPNHELSEDAKWGHELSKNDAAWKKYFGI